MQTIGERLEEARKRKGVSVREAAEATKIRGDYIQKFENNTYDIGLPEIYVRGFLRTYSTYLKLSPDKLLADLNAVVGTAGRAARHIDREVYGRMDLAESTRPSEPKPVVEDEAAVPTVRERPAVAPSVDTALLIRGGIVIGGAILVIVVIGFVISALINRPATKAAALAPAVVADTTQNLTLFGLDATRVKVVQDLDGKTLFQGTLNRGETKTFAKQGRLLITVENGKNLRLEVNGRNYVVPIDGYGRFSVD